jgi:hypothetical protein
LQKQLRPHVVARRYLHQGTELLAAQGVHGKASASAGAAEGGLCGSALVRAGARAVVCVQPARSVSGRLARLRGMRPPSDGRDVHSRDYHLPAARVRGQGASQGPALTAPRREPCCTNGAVHAAARVGVPSSSNTSTPPP